MTTETILAFSAVALLAILSPGPAILLALRNGVAWGLRAVAWSSLGNVTGLLVLSSAAVLGLGVLLKSSALLFGAVKLFGALYLFYLGLRQLWSRSPMVGASDASTSPKQAPRPSALYREAFFLAVTNPKPILFFTALFPQFIHADAPVLPQFLVLTGIFMSLSFATLMSYALLGVRSRGVLVRPQFVKWVNRVVGSLFMGLGAVLLTLRRPVG